MKKQTSSRLTKLGIIALLVIGLPLQSIAQFGLPSIVYDPSSYATLGHIWNEDISTGAKILQEYNEVVKLYTTSMMQYQLAEQMARQMQNRSGWLTTATLMTNRITQNKYGETVNWSAAMNGQWTQAGTAYNNATTRLSPSINLSNETLGSSYHLSNLASVETIDASNTACLQAVSQYRANQQANQPAATSLSSVEVDEGSGSNTEIAQLNQLNAANEQQRAEAESRGTLQACLVEQQALANTIQRNNQVEALNMYAAIQQKQAANPMQLSNVSTSLGATIQ